MRKLRTNGKPIVLGPIWPNVGVQMWYQTTLDALINQASAELLREITQAWHKTPPIFGVSHITAAYGDSAHLVPSAAGIMLFVGEKLLLLHRSDGLGWGLPGGGIEPGETPWEAMRRECREEMRLDPSVVPDTDEHIAPFHIQRWHNVRFATYIQHVAYEFVPNLNFEHDSFQWRTISEWLDVEDLHPGVRATLELMRSDPIVGDIGVRCIPGHRTYTDSDYDDEGFVKPGAGVWVPDQWVLAEDAPSPTKALQIALARWGSQTIRKFDAAATSIATSFAERSRQATQTAMMSQLKKAGFTVAFKPTRRAIEAYRVIAAENIALIKSIPVKYHAEVEAKVWNAVRTGGDLSKLSQSLQKAHRITINRAALIARDQNAKAKATIERERQMELGISRGIWMHSDAGKEPRPTHVAMNGKPYDLAQGMWDEDEYEYVHPGQLINCRCSMRPIIDGSADTDDTVSEGPTNVELEAALENAEKYQGKSRAAEMRADLLRLRALAPSTANAALLARIDQFTQGL